MTLTLDLRSDDNLLLSFNLADLIIKTRFMKTSINTINFMKVYWDIYGSRVSVKVVILAVRY